MTNDLTSVIKRLLSGGHKITHVFDVGANRGTWTAQYEPELPNAHFSLFEANPALPRPPKLDTKHSWFSGVLSSPEIKEVEFYSISNTGDSYYKENTKVYDDCSPIKLQTTTLDEMVTTHNLVFPQLLKLDTQGSELDILQGATDIIPHVDMLVTEVAIMPYNKGAPTFADYIKYLTNFGFVPMGFEKIHHADNMLVQVDVVFLKKNIKDKYYGNNTLVNF